MKPQVQFGLYGAAMGEQAVLRQTQAAVERCTYCGVNRGQPHHPLCKRAGR